MLVLLGFLLPWAIFSLNCSFILIVGEDIFPLFSFIYFKSENILKNSRTYRSEGLALNITDITIQYNWYYPLPSKHIHVHTYIYISFTFQCILKVSSVQSFKNINIFTLNMSVILTTLFFLCVWIERIESERERLYADNGWPRRDSGDEFEWWMTNDRIDIIKKGWCMGD